MILDIMIAIVLLAMLPFIILYPIYWVRLLNDDRKARAKARAQRVWAKKRKELGY